MDFSKLTGAGSELLQYKPMTGHFAHTSVVERIVEQDDGCWVYPGQPSATYPMIQIKGQRFVLHRLVYEEMVGNIPDGLVLDHLCRNTRCVRPDHLEPVTMKENLLRGFGAAAENARKTHCLRGHELTDENTQVRARKDGSRARHCLVCAEERNRVVRWFYANRDKAMRLVNEWERECRSGSRKVS